jgi:hypothetical membrane protein
MTTLGPMVRRSAKVGGLLLLIGSVQFVIGMAVAQWLWVGSYSLSQNDISDLGGPNSAGATVFNVSVRVLGILALVGAALLYRAFAPKTASKVGVALLMIGGLGAIGVGLFPENSPELGGSIHGLATLVAFLGAGLALLVLSTAMLRDTRWDGFRLFTVVGGVVTLVAMTLYVEGNYLGLGRGGMERLVVAPILLWTVLVGVHLARLATYDPTASKAPPIYSSD